MNQLLAEATAEGQKWKEVRNSQEEEVREERVEARVERTEIRKAREREQADMRA